MAGNAGRRAGVSEQPSVGEFLSPFWEKVHACKHERLSPTYCGDVSCTCGLACEEHCLDCGVFLCRDDPCGEQVGMSGWPAKRWQAHWRRRAGRRRCA